MFVPSGHDYWPWYTEPPIIYTSQLAAHETAAQKYHRGIRE